MRTESPDNDSAFSDSISLISSESSTSSSTAPSTHNNQVCRTFSFFSFTFEPEIRVYIYIRVHVRVVRVYTLFFFYCVLLFRLSRKFAFYLIWAYWAEASDTCMYLRGSNPFFLVSEFWFKKIRVVYWAVMRSKIKTETIYWFRFGYFIFIMPAVDYPRLHILAWFLF